ncbi:MAG: outer membrane protein assembly factor BamD [bacterium]|nr:outer membrane protein assembly factor BamD [bacterium]
MNRFGLNPNRCLALMVLILAFAWHWGCTKQERVRSDFELYQGGMNLFEKKKYLDARKQFQDIEVLYPESRYLPLARVGIANTYYEEGAYYEAAVEYRKVLEFYPLGKLSDWAQYRLGMCHFKQMLSEDRDQEETQEACSAFETFLAQYPKSPLVNEAREKYQICKDRLGSHELSIAKFYLKSKYYEVAIARLQEILSHYPQFSRKDEVFYYLAKAAGKSGKRQLEKEAVQTLISQYPSSRFTQRLFMEKKELKKVN